MSMAKRADRMKRNLSMRDFELVAVAMVGAFALSTPGLARAAEDEPGASGEKSDEKPRAPMKSQADIDKEAGTGQKEKGDEDTFGHGFQFGLRGGVVLGYKMDFRYQHSPLCTPYDASKGSWDQQQKICGFGSSPAAEVALSFAVLDSLEPYVFGRFGFSAESKTDTTAQFLFGAGVRLYTMSDSRFKIFIEPGIAYEGDGAVGSAEYNPPGLNPEYKKDLIFHLGIGPQYDFAKQFGAYINTGLDVGVLRSISAALILNIGIQLRMP